MKYWKKSNGECGTMDDDGFVPDSVEVSKTEYDNFVASQPIIESVEEIVEFEDLDSGKKYRMKRI